MSPHSAGAALQSPVPPELVLWFRRALAIKVALHVVIPSPFQGLPWLTDPTQLALLAAGVLLATRRQDYWIGVLILLGFEIRSAVAVFPYTANHWFVEILALTILFLFGPESPRDRNAATVDGTACRLLQLTVLSVWLYGGLQKVVHGFYLDGEMLAHRALFDPSFTVGTQLRWLLRAGEAVFGAEFGALPYGWPDLSHRVPVPLPAWAVALFLFVGWAIVFLEIAPVLLMLTRKYRAAGLRLLVATSVVIGVSSGEISFAIDNLLCLLLFYPRHPRWTYPTMIGVTFAAFLGRAQWAV